MKIIEDKIKEGLFSVGIILKENAQNLLVFGNLFINLLSTVIVPIIIVSITLAIAKIKPNKTLSLLKKIFLNLLE